MNLLQDVQKLAMKGKKVPVIEPGFTVKIHQKIKEGEKERIQMFEGLVIKINSGFGADKSITVRKIVEGIGVEKIFPLYSTNIVKIEVKKTSKVRRAKLYYMRERFGKSARLKESFVSGKEVDESVEELAASMPAEDENLNVETAAVEETAVMEETPVEETAQAEEEQAVEAESEAEVATKDEEEKTA